ncbi:NAD(P)H-dependent oxidoreductase [uncultured Cohaesibacter sp.]|uniref:NAD(P)H-dependent oxidoreductase n=1 Tax=uncultured Cohaesibacter sp. TaxID=1002546 RepID=UPI0029C79286|nr:NAD(P)H-dependent oxidoreductase [uncultured Cohaesibacter sp.]
MKAHIVLAHPEPQSYNAHLARIAREQLEHEGYSVTISDLYAMDFDPCERASHYAHPIAPDRFDVQSEQRHASTEGTIAHDIQSEIARLEAADLLILQYPMWWHLPPAILKGWMDRVFVYGSVYTSRKRFENGAFTGKKAMLSVTVGTSRQTYDHNGRSGDIGLMLWPVNFNLAYVGFDVLEPFIAYGVEAGLRYSSADEVERRLQAIAEDLKQSLSQLASRASIPFNRMDEWGPDGHILPNAPSYSPFIRHKKQLVLD